MEECEISGSLARKFHTDVKEIYNIHTSQPEKLTKCDVEHQKNKTKQKNMLLLRASVGRCFLFKANLVPVLFYI
jgi:hypothetical protein